MINNFLNSKNGRILISIVWGLGLAALFRKVCKGRNCLIVRGPHPMQVTNKIYKFNNKCYRYSTQNISCKKSGNINI